MKRIIFSIILAAVCCAAAIAQDIRTEKVLSDWEFKTGHSLWTVDGWKKVKVPHDWAIYGPFDRSHDLQGKQQMTGRTGGLPYVGKGTYRSKLKVESGTLDGRRHILLFDGAMSEAQIYVKGKRIFFWPYGYNSFWCDITDHIMEGMNDIAVFLENQPQSSRWYPGAGLYRKVRYITLPKVHIPIWGTFVYTPHVCDQYATVTVRTKIEGLEEGTTVTIRTSIKDMDGNVITRKVHTSNLFNGEITQHLTVNGPRLWSPEDPYLYYADTEIYAGGSFAKDNNIKERTAYAVEDGNILLDKVRTRFGIRSIEVRPEKGFFLNGKPRKFQGVCMHHDLGPLGAAVNKAALRRQITILKDMGCDAIRTSHNVPAEELVELCDEMGMMVMVESFDEWDQAKCKNGYHRFFNEDSGNGITWAERDMVNMLQHFRNNPSVVMWSIGNEVPSQKYDEGKKVAAWLQDICHREDPTRPVTCGMDRIDHVLGNGFAATLDIAGFNYKVDSYPDAYRLLPHAAVLGSETASTVSSRGVYHFPLEYGAQIKHEDHQSSSYDMEFCPWSNIPDEDFAADEDYEWSMGQFVWTGFDYLGEPTPYDVDSWPNHSSVFGIVDLAYIPKDRYYLYRSVWNKEEATLHILPHWNWSGREGQVTPVYVYTSYPSAELFINGKSQGIKTKAAPSGNVPELGRRAMERYRLMWDDVVYRPGEVKVIAYDKDGNPAMEKTIRTSAKAYAVRLVPDRRIIEADGNDICFVNVSLTDAEGNTVPDDNRLLNIKVEGAGSFRAVANGDPTCLEPFHKPQMHLFNGQMTVLIQSGTKPGNITVEVSGKGVRKAVLTIAAEAKAPNEHIRKATRTMDSMFSRFTSSKAPLMKETFPSELQSECDLYTYSGILSAAVAIMKKDPGYINTINSRIIPGIEKYHDSKRTPVAYASKPSGSASYPRYYDDNIMIGTDYVDLFLITGNRLWIEKAEKIWKFVESGIDNALEGGVYWCEQKKNCKKSSSNASGAVLAAKLFMATGNQDYLDWAKGLYVWTKEKMMDEDGIYLESMKLTGEKDDTRLPYCSGHMIQAGSILFKLTGRKEYLEDARKTAAAYHEKYFIPNPEQTWHHSVTLRGLIDLYQIDGNPEYLNDIRKSLENAWVHARSESGLFNEDMSGKAGSQKYRLSTQSAMAEMYARIGAMMDL